MQVFLQRPRRRRSAPSSCYIARPLTPGVPCRGLRSVAQCGLPIDLPLASSAASRGRHWRCSWWWRSWRARDLPGPPRAPPPPPPPRAARPGHLQKQIASGHRRISSLSGAVASDTRRVTELNRAAAAMAAKVDGLQRDLTAKLPQLYALRSELSSAKVRLKRLETTETTDEQVLAAQLVGTYEGGQPNIVDVVLQST